MNEVKFNFVKALTQFGKETAKGGRKFQVSRSIGWSTSVQVQRARIWRGRMERRAAEHRNKV